MPWEAMSTIDCRREFVLLAGRADANVRELCRRFGVSPRIGYKWLGRWKELGDAGLTDRSRRPNASPRRSPAEIEAAVLAVRAEHPAWGGRKIARVLQNEGRDPPSASTITAILRRHGVALGSFGGGEAAFTRFEHEAPNELWQMDFKGHVGLSDGGRLNPLTVLDDCSRYCIVLSACADQRTESVRDRLVTAFRRYGLPRRIITDNGSPWGDGPGSPYTPLGVFLMEQGIGVVHSRPYHPQTMGKDERFHRSLKAEVLAGRRFDDLVAAQQAFERWRAIYNTKRPHEALAMAVPMARYRASPRSYREQIEPFDHAPGDHLRKVEETGRISFEGKLRRVPKAFRGKTIALRPTEVDGCYEVFFRHQRIATLDCRTSSADAQPVTHVPEHPLPISPV